MWSKKSTSGYMQGKLNQDSEDVSVIPHSLKCYSQEPRYGNHLRVHNRWMDEEPMGWMYLYT